jgi:hypothetical protein
MLHFFNAMKRSMRMLPIDPITVGTTHKEPALRLHWQTQLKFNFVGWLTPATPSTSLIILTLHVPDAPALLPAGWEKMDTVEKVTELYLGERGILYWATQAAWYSIWILVAAWVLFRFVGPSLGIYNLSTDISPPAL